VVGEGKRRGLHCLKDGFFCAHEREKDGFFLAPLFVAFRNYRGNGEGIKRPGDLALVTDRDLEPHMCCVGGRSGCSS
jgi:hypothetical protein